MKEVRITLADVGEIPRAELKFAGAPKYEVRKLGKPKVLMEGKHLRLPDTPWPHAPDRGFVLVQDGPGHEANVLEARLLDLRTGKVLATLRSLYRPAYHKLGVAFGEAEVDGELHEVLVHVSDGQIVPLWPVEQGQARFVVINAGTGDAWVFEEQKKEDGAEEDPYPPYRYAYWGDLRKRPPEPKEAFAHWLNEDSSPPGGWLGPTWTDPAEAPLFLDVDSMHDDADECAKVEMRPEGYDCVPYGTWAMAGGWRGTVERKQAPVMSNAEKGVAQVLDIGKECVIEEVTLDPPRALVLCSESYDRFLWSPEKIVRIRSGIHGTHSWGRDRHVKTITHYLEPEGVERIGQTWFDVAGLQIIDSPGRTSMTSTFQGEWLTFSTEVGAERYMKDPNTNEAHRLPIDTRDCARLSNIAGEGPMFIVGCLDDDDDVKRIVLVDAEARALWPLPTLDGIWTVPSQRAIVGLQRSSGRSRVVGFAIE